MVRILTILPVGIENLKKLAWIAWISRSSGLGPANWVDFAQFAVNFESSIYHGANWKMVCEFRIICGNGGLFWLLGGCTWIFNCRHVCKWHRFRIIHNLKYKNTFTSKMTMSVNGKTTCILLPAIEAVCTWLTSWIAFGGSTGAGLHSSGSWWSCWSAGLFLFVLD